MKTIIQPIRTVAALCGPQQSFSSKARLANHCVCVQCEDGRLLYHTLTGELILLEPGDTLENQREALIRRRFLVPDDFDEIRYADQVLHTVRLAVPPSNRFSGGMIFTTTDCNARCFYCYELGRKRMNMSDETAHDIVEYIAGLEREEDLFLSWFGGEPLFNRRVIDIITGGLREKGIRFHCQMISNGYLFDEETVSAAKNDWNLQSIQIALDGTEEIYNKTKAYIHREGSAYQRVMRNIGLLLEAGINVSIRLNTDAGNAQDLRMLARELKDRFGQYDNLHVYVALIHDFGGIKHDFKSREEMLRCYKELREDLKTLGITKPRMLNRKILLNSCIADDDSRMTFLPDGHIGRCEHESETGFVGSIYTEEKDTALIAAWKEKLRSRACGDCPIYPRCDLLKKCAWYAEGCTEITRAIMRINIEDQILNSYKMEMNRDKKPAETDFMPDENC